MTEAAHRDPRGGLQHGHRRIAAGRERHREHALAMLITAVAFMATTVAVTSLFAPQPVLAPTSTGPIASPERD